MLPDEPVTPGTGSPPGDVEDSPVTGQYPGAGLPADRAEP